MSISVSNWYCATAGEEADVSEFERRDDGCDSIFEQLRLPTRLRDLAALIARGLLSISLPSPIKGAGKAGCALHPRSRVQNALEKTHTSIQVSGGTPAFPAQWFYGLYVVSSVTGLVDTVVD